LNNQDSSFGLNRAATYQNKQKPRVKKKIEPPLIDALRFKCIIGVLQSTPLALWGTVIFRWVTMVLENSSATVAQRVYLWTIQRDKDPKHTARCVKQIFQDEHIDVLDWPAQSPKN